MVVTRLTESSIASIVTDRMAGTGDSITRQIVRRSGRRMLRRTKNPNLLLLLPRAFNVVFVVFTGTPTETLIIATWGVTGVVRARSHRGHTFEPTVIASSSARRSRLLVHRQDYARDYHVDRKRHTFFLTAILTSLRLMWLLHDIIGTCCSTNPRHGSIIASHWRLESVSLPSVKNG